jgi:hypothetical protein
MGIMLRKEGIAESAGSADAGGEDDALDELWLSARSRDALPPLPSLTASLELMWLRAQRALDIIAGSALNSSAGLPLVPWQPDASRVACGCGARFMLLFTRRHHCRLCGALRVSPE